MICCCGWGEARRNSDEWPEFECKDCPVHCEGLGPIEDRCKRHRRAYDEELLEEARAQRETVLNDRSRETIADLVELRSELS